MSDLNDISALLGEAGDTGQSGGSALRKQLEAVLAERKQLSEQLAVLQAESRTRKVAELFDKHSIPELAKDFFPSDAELTDESVARFVEKYGPLWGATAVEAAVTPEEQAQAAAMQRLTSQAATPPATPLSKEVATSRYAEAKTREELMQMVAQATQGYEIALD